jgi:hypothetical protein
MEQEISILITVIVIFIILLIVLAVFAVENFTNGIMTTEFFKIKTIIKEKFSLGRKFMAPNSFTKIKKLRIGNNTGNIGNNTGNENGINDSLVLTEQQLIKILEKLPIEPTEYKGNTMSFPAYFNCSEKWIGCLPRAMNQVNCGSCWAFASVTALSARFYIGSCGLSGCFNYPQINFESMNNVHSNINDAYKFRLLYLTDVFKNIDTSKNNKINKDEWIYGIVLYFDTINNSLSSPQDINDAYQILIYLLDFQSLGSVNLSSKEEVIERANKSFDIWKKFTIELVGTETETVDSVYQSEINLSKLLEYWANSPITLSAEKLITCCSECIELDFLKDKNKRGRDNPACLGSSLDDAWTSLRSNGVPTASCIGYTLDSWEEGMNTPSCRETQGPLYGFCSGPGIRKSVNDPEFIKNINDEIDKMENSGIDPIAMPYSSRNTWTEPQLFRFRAKNVYNIANNSRAIQEEIMTRGPVTTGFSIYPDFQYEFGTDGMGGQLWIDTSFENREMPLGSTKNSLIYKWNGIDEDLGGHAVVIVGWGELKWKEYLIPYWICLNSWGTEWGHCGYPDENNRTGPPLKKEGGYFWILRSINECDIENNVVCGEPDLENITYPGVVQKYGWNVASPPSDDKNVKYVEQSFDPIVLDNDNKIIFKKATPGSGSYPDRIKKDGKFEWVINYMKAPSPYTLFWPDDRPTFRIGNLTSDLSPDPFKTIVNVSGDTLKILEKVIKIQKNPLLTIDDEQLQYLSSNGNSIKVYRGVNNSKLSGHFNGAEIKIVPFHELDISTLNNILSKL